MCVDPTERPVVASMGQLFVDPKTGRVSEKPQRFVHGIASEAVAEVYVAGPGRSPEPLRLTTPSGARFKVFAGPAPSAASPGRGKVIAENATGRIIGEHGLDFSGPAHQSQEDAAAHEHGR